MAFLNRGRRDIGVLGTMARILLGLYFVVSVIVGHVRFGFHIAPFLLGLIGFPCIVVLWRFWRSRRNPSPAQYTSPLSFSINAVIFFALWLTPFYAPALSITSDAALLFYGASMLISAARGYAGCEVLAVPNWLLHRNDELGCALFEPVDYFERNRRG